MVLLVQLWLIELTLLWLIIVCAGSDGGLLVQIIGRRIVEGVVLYVGLLWFEMSDDGIGGGSLLESLVWLLLLLIAT